eukprot:m.69965 g.69965  ORF g.69965 m.69965 type:complete len:227 (+) comp13756_c0_seq2:130-810(+)
MSRKLKILCLHGYRQSKDAFHSKTGSFRKGLKKFADFVLFDAPHRINPDAPMDDPASEELGWYFCHDRYYHSTEETANYVGFEESLTRVQQVMAEEGPFDGVLAFSQGAQFLATLCAHMQQARLQGKELPLAFNFAVLVSGFKSYSKQDQGVFNPDVQIDIPSLHIMGTTDQVIPVELSQHLATYFVEPVVVKHDGGHFVPWPKANTAERDTITSFFTQMQQRFAQ